MILGLGYENKVLLLVYKGIMELLSMVAMPAVESLVFIQAHYIYNIQVVY